MIDRKYPSSERGDCLVFLSGINEIMTLFDAIQLYAAESNKWIVLPLHSSLSIEQQDAVFNIPPEGVRLVLPLIQTFPPEYSNYFYEWSYVGRISLALFGLKHFF